MKSLIKLLSILAISSPIPLTVVGCDHKKETQKVELETLNQKLNDEVTKLTTNIPAKINKKNKELDRLINRIIKNLDLSPNLVKLQIKYFNDEKCKNDISDQPQKAGNLYMVISADVNDGNYQGSTKPIKINLKENATKINLNTITKLSGFDITANPSKTYKQLISNINNFNEFKLTPLAVGYQLQFYNENNEDITNDKQELENISKIIVKITSSFDDENYQGSTNIDLTNQTIIIDQDMQNYFAKVTVPLANFTPQNPATPATKDKKQAVANVVKSLKTIQKKYESITKAILKGMYQEKIDLTKLRNENEIYDINQQPVANNWFEKPASGKEANVLIFYGNTEKGYFFPIWIDIT